MIIVTELLFSSTGTNSSIDELPGATYQMTVENLQSPTLDATPVYEVVLANKAEQIVALQLTTVGEYPMGAVYDNRVAKIQPKYTEPFDNPPDS